MVVCPLKSVRLLPCTVQVFDLIMYFFPFFNSNQQFLYVSYIIPFLFPLLNRFRLKWLTSKWLWFFLSSFAWCPMVWECLWQVKMWMKTLRWQDSSEDSTNVRFCSLVCLCNYIHAIMQTIFNFPWNDLLNVSWTCQKWLRYFHTGTKNNFRNSIYKRNIAYFFSWGLEE